jgi:hypothetical protein
MRSICEQLRTDFRLLRPPHRDQRQGDVWSWFSDVGVVRGRISSFCNLSTWVVPVVVRHEGLQIECRVLADSWAFPPVQHFGQFVVRCAVYCTHAADAENSMQENCEKWEIAAENTAGRVLFNGTNLALQRLEHSDSR